MKYYASPAIRSRLLEFLGGSSPEAATAAYFTTASPALRFEPRSPDALWETLDTEPELNRSLWDHRSVLAHLELDHVNFDDPWQPLRDPRRSLEIQADVVRCLLNFLERFGITPLHLLSGRGHHFVWSIALDHPCAIHLAHVAPLPPGLAELYARPHRPAGDVVEPLVAGAFAGMGLLMEWLAQEVMGAASCPVPLQMTAVEAEPGSHGREAVSIDLSEYGDPLHKRTLRMPFSLYRKGGACLAMVPLNGLCPSGLDAPRTPDGARELAESSSAAIPHFSGATINLLEAYRTSRLAAFHRWYYDHPLAPRPGWGHLDLPPCLRRPLEQPNDLLLKPAVLQHVVRAFLAHHWHPREIAGLISSRLEEDHGWLRDLHFYHAGQRADFYVRTFAGLIASGLDELRDFNCRSHQRKGFCEGACGQSLEPWRSALVRLNPLA